MMYKMNGITVRYFIYNIYRVIGIDYYCEGNRLVFPPDTGGKNASIGGNVSWSSSGLVITVDGEKLFLSLIELCAVLLSVVEVLQLV